MIQAQRSLRFEKIFALYNDRYLLRRNFHSFGVRGNIDPVAEGRPVIYLMNHSSWWDGLVVFHAVMRLSSRKHYLMMDELQMKRYPFFRKIGAFSVDKTGARSVMESLRYAEDLLKDGKPVWLFPQGDIYPLERRPLKFSGGAAYLLERHPEAVIQPVTAYYSLTMHQKPDVSLFFGCPQQGECDDISRKEATSALERMLEMQLEEHRKQVIAGNGRASETDFRSLLRGNQSVSDTFYGFKRGVAKWSSFFGR
ncbi:lysophospholipid acyltransferase family protein [Cohnella abietis]|uniref:Glycerol acyltransferase n=1 Tax=Cohnella abietis TaxID=2507935 RepID=A0A3T1D6D5_9BACL|nr:lysophospholipid acyltransferase family protein [Cohnella abietis]BBI33634.1 glycerol acyltransferase [Cohnella abietis]